MAPVYLASGANPNSLVLASQLINIAAFSADYSSSANARIRRGPRWALDLTVYQAFLGPQVMNGDWPVWLAHLPFAVTILLLAAVASGRLGYLPAALLGCSFVVQSYMSYTLCLAVAMGVSLSLWAAPGAVRAALGIHRPRSGRLRVVLPASLALLVLVWLPTLIRETASHGADFGLWLDYLRRSSHYSWRQAAMVWMQALACAAAILHPRLRRGHWSGPGGTVTTFSWTARGSPRNLSCLPFPSSPPGAIAMIFTARPLCCARSCSRRRSFPSAVSKREANSRPWCIGKAASVCCLPARVRQSRANGYGNGCRRNGPASASS